MNTPQRKYALLSGVALLVMALAAAYSYGYVHSQLIVPDNPSQTLANLQGPPTYFGSSLWGWGIIFITDLLVTWGLYHFFAATDQKISLITASIRALYTLILAFAISYLFSAWNMLGEADPDATVLMMALADFEKYWSLGLIIFGFHLLGLGYLSLKSGLIPLWMGYLLYIVGISYSSIHGLKLVVPQATDSIATAEMILSLPMAIAEIALAIWLIARGGRIVEKMSHLPS